MSFLVKMKISEVDVLLKYFFLYPCNSWRFFFI